MIQILQGDCLSVLPTLPDQSVQCCVTSPPYWGLRDYGVKGQLGLEKTPQEYVEKIVAMFREVKRVLRDDGTLWLNLGDCYAGAGYSNHKNTGGATREQGGKQHHTRRGSGRADGIVTETSPRNRDGVGAVLGLKPKDLVGIPWRVAFALQADGWYLRSDNIWSKPNPMPESVTDRPTKAHEYIFLLTKKERYFYDAEAISEPIQSDHFRGPPDHPDKLSTNGNSGLGQWAKRAKSGNKERDFEGRLNHKAGGIPREGETRNKRSVWTVATSPYSEAHFATFPPDLIKPCILAGSRPGDTILDPFGGSGTTGQVALELGRKAILIELNPEYCKLIKDRTNVTPGLPL